MHQHWVKPLKTLLSWELCVASLASDQSSQLRRKQPQTLESDWFFACLDLPLSDCRSLHVLTCSGPVFLWSSNNGFRVSLCSPSRLHFAAFHRWLFVCLLPHRKGRNDSVLTRYLLTFLMPEEEEDQLRNFTLSREMVFNVFRQFVYEQEDEAQPLYIAPDSLQTFWRHPCGSVGKQTVQSTSLLHLALNWGVKSLLPESESLSGESVGLRACRRAEPPPVAASGCVLLSHSYSSSIIGKLKCTIARQAIGWWALSSGSHQTFCLRWLKVKSKLRFLDYKLWFLQDSLCNACTEGGV